MADDFTLEQKRALALARARRRRAQEEGARAPERQQTFGERLSSAALGGFGDEVADGIVAGVAGSAMGAANAVKQRDLGAIPRTIAQEYSKLREQSQLRERQFQEERPVTAAALDIAGTSLGLGKAGGAINQIPGVGQGLVRLPTSVRVGLGGAASSGVVAAGQAPDGEKLEEGLKAAPVGAVTSVVMNKAVGGLNNLFKKSNIKNAPPIKVLKDKAQMLYRRAEQNGVKINGKTTQKIADRMRDRMVKEGIRLPSGEFIDDQMTAIKGVDKVLAAFEGKEITPLEAMTIRRAFANAAGSLNKNEARIGRMLLQRYDGFLSRVAPEIKQANALWHRASKAEMVNKARTSLADVRAGQYSQSGIDNALRTEFRQIYRKLEQGKLKGFTKAERDAIKRVANGTITRNVARDVGKLAPNSLGGQMITSGGVLGSVALQSPETAALFAGTAGAGYGGKALANRLAVKQAETAELLIRAGVDEAMVNRLTSEQVEQVALLLAARLAPEIDDAAYSVTDRLTGGQDRSAQVERTRQQSEPEQENRR